MNKMKTRINQANVNLVSCPVISNQAVKRIRALRNKLLELLLRYSLIIACLNLLPPAKAQSFEFETFVSGGTNISYGTTAPLYRQTLTPTFCVQGNLGYWFSRRIGMGTGLTYFPVGVRSIFSMNDLGKDFKYIYSYTDDYLLMPHLYVCYALPESHNLFSVAEIRLGLLFASDSQGSDFDFDDVNPLRDGRLVYISSNTVVNPHTFVGLEGRLDFNLFKTSRHQLFGVVHIIKGLTTIREVTHQYSVGSPSLDQQSFLRVNGDYLGLGISYRWKLKK